ncbi:MAG TPA: hypothetical protein VMT00_08235 [Thermoanaerobaculia bacterium]|nr:hypothetical protein [Thermoanaerobaculia bacterium]
MSRTTLDIDDPVLQEIREIQKREGGSLGKVVSRLLADAVASGQRKDERSSGFRWHSQAMIARIDLRDKDALFALLDESP